MEEEELLVKRNHPDARLPTRGSDYSAGLDLYSIEDFEIQPFFHIDVSTGISMSIPHGYYGRIAPRSSLALRNGICVGAGVVDEDYRGAILP